MPSGGKFSRHVSNARGSFEVRRIDIPTLTHIDTGICLLNVARRNRRSVFSAQGSARESYEHVSEMFLCSWSIIATSGTKRFEAHFYRNFFMCCSVENKLL